MMTSATITMVTMAAFIFTAAANAEPEVIQSGISLEPAPKPEKYKAGDVFKALKNGDAWQWSLAAVNEESQTWEASDGCRWTRSSLFYMTPSSSWENCGGNSGSASVRHTGGESWPIKVGSEWSFAVSGDNWQTDRDCEVEGTARIKIRNGEFDTFKVVCVDSWRTRTSYYAPSVGRAVYSENLHRIRLEKDIYEYVPN